MHHQVNAISGRLSLRSPQHQSLVILDRVMETVQPHKNKTSDAEAIAHALTIIQSEYPTVTDFERTFPSLCFALATGVGKTRLMGAFITYLRLAHGLRNFFVLAPNLTIYNKLIADFTPNTPKYVFRGIAEFVTTSPIIVTGDNYESGLGTHTSLFAGYGDEITINIFNISKINSEVRGGKSPRIKRLSEYIGDSYFNYLASLPDLVMLMDESHRYRASAGARAINDLQPILGLELTATPFVEKPKGAIPFKNVVYDYPLGAALRDGFVKEPAVVTQKNFQPQQYSRPELEQIKMEDGIRLHENTKVELETYARQTGNPIVKPFILVIARDTTHAAELLALVESDNFFNGQYKGKVIQVDSSTKGKKEDQMVERLLAVESSDEPTEIVIHVNMLKEGWDVTNLYTIIPSRAANARILIEQSIGRGLRLPFGRRTGVKAVDRLSIVAHDKFQEIVDEANRPGSVIRLEQVILDPNESKQRLQTVIATPTVLRQLGGGTAQPTQLLSDHAETVGQIATEEPLFKTEPEQRIAQLAYEAIQQQRLPSTAALQNTAVIETVVRKVRAAYVPPAQSALPSFEEVPAPDIEDIIKNVIPLIMQGTIDIPRIVVTPIGNVTAGFNPFILDTTSVRYQPVDRDLLIQSLQTNEQESLKIGNRVVSESRLEDYLVRKLIDFSDISYDDQADMLYELAGQMVAHLESYLHDEEDVMNVVRYYERPLSTLIHTQMQSHRWEKVSGYEVKVTQGFTPLKESAFTAAAGQSAQDFHIPPTDKSKIRKIVFVGFSNCLYEQQKFDSDAERRLAIILDRESEKWFKPMPAQFRIFYQSGIEQRMYQPDFVAETATDIFLLEPKGSGNMSDADVLAKRDAAVTWCQNATTHTTANGGKPWQYALIPHDAITENMTLTGLVAQYHCA